MTTTDTTSTTVQAFAQAVLDELPAHYGTDATMFHTLWAAAERHLVAGCGPLDDNDRGLVHVLAAMLSIDGSDGSSVLVLPVVGKLWCAAATTEVFGALAALVRRLSAMLDDDVLHQLASTCGGELDDVGRVLRSVLVGADGSELVWSYTVPVAGAGLLWGVQSVGNLLRVADSDGPGTV
jgi:hypothetical protein